MTMFTVTVNLLIKQKQNIQMEIILSEFILS